MSIKTITVVAIVSAVALAGAGWFFRDTETVRGAAGSVAGFAKSIVPDNSYTVAKTDGEKNGKGSHALRKCVSEARTVYTDEKCPAGTREAPISEGNVTVVPGARAVEKAKKSEEKAK